MPGPQTHRPSSPRRTTSSVSSITGADAYKKTRRPVSTVSHAGGPKRILTYHGTPVSRKGIAPRKAPGRAKAVNQAITRARAAMRHSRLTPPYDADEAAALIRRVGGTESEARALSTKVAGESGGDPKAVGSDAAAGYGNTFGLGLWQITTGVGNDDLIARYGGKKAMLRPKPNAKAALDIYRSSGLGAWYAPSSAPGSSRNVPSGHVSKRDKRILRKAGASVRPTKGAPAPGANKKPFKRAAGQASNAARIVNPKWDDETKSYGTGMHGVTMLAKGISPVVRKWAKKYNVDVGEAKADSGHVSPGHLSTGTATDLYPKQNTDAGWDRLERGLAVLAKAGFEVGYDGSVPGTQAWSGHGRGNHAHVEWVGNGSDLGAIKRLGGLTNAQIQAMMKGASGGASVPMSAITGYAQANGISVKKAKQIAKKNPEQILAAKKKKLAKIQSIFKDRDETEPDLDSLERRYGRAVA